MESADGGVGESGKHVKIPAFAGILRGGPERNTLEIYFLLITGTKHCSPAFETL